MFSAAELLTSTRYVWKRFRRVCQILLKYWCLWIIVLVNDVCLLTCIISILTAFNCVSYHHSIWVRVKFLVFVELLNFEFLRIKVFFSYFFQIHQLHIKGFRITFQDNTTIFKELNVLNLLFELASELNTIQCLKLILKRHSSDSISNTAILLLEDQLKMFSLNG